MALWATTPETITLPPQQPVGRAGHERRHLGPRLLDSKPLRKHHRRLHDAQDFLRRRGGWAVFLGRFVAFFRAVMLALADASRMRYLKFLASNAFGGIISDVGFVFLRFLAGASYETVAKAAGRRDGR